MRLSIIAVGSLCMALGLGFAPGCSSDDDDNADAGTGGRGGTGGSTGGTGGSTGGTGGSTGGTGGSTGGTGGSTGGTGGSAAVTYPQVKPIFMTRCTPCHEGTGQGAGAHKLAEAIDDAKKNSYSCPTKTKGACTLDRIKNGTMPLGKGCSRQRRHRRQQDRLPHPGRTGPPGRLDRRRPDVAALTAESGVNIRPRSREDGGIGRRTSLRC